MMNIEIREGHLEDRDLIAQFQVDMAWETESYKLDYDTVIKGVEAVLKNRSEEHTSELQSQR
jgi:hypothetical protein